MKNLAVREYLTGTIESVVFYSPDTGYTVCRFSLEDGKSLTIIGNFPPLSPGEMLKVKGKWEINPRFGQQFQVESFMPIMPSSEKGVEKFLSSGLIHGIGPVLANRIIRKFGLQILEILSQKPAKLTAVEGIGKAKLREIKKSWEEHKEIRELIIFLQEHNVSTTLATKIYKQYGQKSFLILKSNPYQVCHDIWGIGFRTADQMALKLGMSETSPERARAFICYLMEKDTEKGHVFSLSKDLEKTCQKELELNADQFRAALEVLIKEKNVIVKKIEKGQAVYLPFFYHAEEEVAKSIGEIISFPKILPEFDLEKALIAIQKGSHIRFSSQQKQAIRECLLKNLLVITGGPGTGKTTIVKAVVDIFHERGREILLAAPTGRAAKRLHEATGKEARTLHRTLEYIPKLSGFRRNEQHPLQGDVLLIDEFSMVDLPLMYYLLKAVPREMSLILVGDKDQLPSVGPGTLLRDIIASGIVDVVTLDKIFRQKKDSLIVTNAHRINRGDKIIKPDKGDSNSDFYFLYHEDEQKAFQIIIQLCSNRIPNKLKLDPISSEIQVISPMYRGLVGVDNLNIKLQEMLNPRQDGLKFGNRDIRIGDKVMQIKNNYDKGIFNGDIGKVADINKQAYRIAVNFDGRKVDYAREEINELVLAYAISVHKAQGSEYQAVVFPLMTQHYIMLQRNLFYTALSRAKKLCCIVGSYKALHIAINNNKPVNRNCSLQQKLEAISKKNQKKES